LHSGSFQDVSEQIACRRRCRVLRQARIHSQRETGSSSRRRPRPKWRAHLSFLQGGVSSGHDNYLL
jgi:hypothetical protein